MILQVRNTKIDLLFKTKIIFLQLEMKNYKKTNLSEYISEIKKKVNE